MNEFLEKAQKYSKGFIDDPKEIDRIISKLLHSELSELRTENYNTLFWGEDVMLQLDLPHHHPETLLFGELLELTRVNCIRTDSPEYARWLKTMLEATSETLSSVKMFTMISVKAFMEFMDKKSGGSKCMKFYGGICDKIRLHLNFKECHISDKSMTIGQLLKKWDSCFRWKDSQPIEKFTEKAYAACEIIKMLIVDSLYEGYGSEFRTPKIRGEMEREYPDWDFGDFDRLYWRLYKNGAKNVIFDKDMEERFGNSDHSFYDDDPKKNSESDDMDDPDESDDFDDDIELIDFDEYFDEDSSDPQTMADRIKELIRRNSG